MTPPPALPPASVKSSQDGVGKAVSEVKTLVGFMELIGGNLSHICAWLHQPQLVSDLHGVLGPAGFRAVPAATGEQDLPRDVVRRLAACFANRPELLLAMLDVALPRCQSPPKELEEQWSALAKDAAPVPILDRMAEPPRSPRTAATTFSPEGSGSSSRVDDAPSSTLSPEPAKQGHCRRMAMRLAQPSRRPK